MSDNLALIKQLRESTGAGIADCKKAIEQSSGNIENAIKILRESGIAKAAKKLSNIASHGLAGFYRSSPTSASVCEVNCQTDFAAKNTEFVSFVSEVSSILHSASCNLQTALGAKTKSGAKLEDDIKSKIATIGENISIRRAQTLSVDKGVVAAYIHNSSSNLNFGEICVLLAIKSDISNTSKLEDLGKKICMHIAAMRPLALNENEVDAKVIQSEKEIYTKQAKETGKPDNVIEKMVEGRVKKFLAENVLSQQAFVMDSKSTVQDFINTFKKDNSCTIELVNFVVYKVGEGIEKAESNFADEVQKIVGSAS